MQITEGQLNSIMQVLARELQNLLQQYGITTNINIERQCGYSLECHRSVFCTVITEQEVPRLPERIQSELGTLYILQEDGYIEIIYYL